MSNPKAVRAAAAAVAGALAPAGSSTTIEQQRAAEKDKAEPERKVEQMQPIRMQDADFGRLEKVCVAHENTLPEDLLKQDYWAHVAQDLRPWTRIEVRANDGTWLWEGVVLEAGRNWANVKQLQLHHFTTKDIALTNAAIQAEYAGSPYEVRYRGEFELWSVIRKSDNAVMHDKEGTKAGADQWLKGRQQADRQTG